MKKFHTKSQVDMLKEHFDNGYSISRVTAIAQFGILNLPARITDLRQKGYPVAVEMRMCEGTPYAKYYNKNLYKAK